MSWVDEHEPGDEEIERSIDDLYGELRGVRLNTTKKRRRKPLDHERKGKKGRTSPVIDYVRSLGNYLVTSEVAKELGVSEGQVRKWARDRVTQAPSKVAPFGHTHVNLYTPDDVKALKSYIRKNRVVYDRDEFFGKEK